MKPLLGLVMVVRNEARGLAATLASALPFVDRWTILGFYDQVAEVHHQ